MDITNDINIHLKLYNIKKKYMKDLYYIINKIIASNNNVALNIYIILYNIKENCNTSEKIKEFLKIKRLKRILLKSLIIFFLLIKDTNLIKTQIQSIKPHYLYELNSIILFYKLQLLTCQVTYYKYLTQYIESLTIEINSLKIIMLTTKYNNVIENYKIKKLTLENEEKYNLNLKLEEYRNLLLHNYDKELLINNYSSICISLIKTNIELFHYLNTRKHLKICKEIHLLRIQKYNIIKNNTRIENSQNQLMILQIIIKENEENINICNILKNYQETQKQKINYLITSQIKNNKNK